MGGGRESRGSERGESDGSIFTDEGDHKGWTMREDIVDGVHGPKVDAELMFGDAASRGRET